MSTRFPKRDEIRAFFRELSGSISRTAPFDIAAELAFWALLAVFPFVIVVLTLIGYVPMHGVDTQLMGYVYHAMPPAAAKLIDQTVHEVIGKQRGWLLALSLAGSIWSASGGVSSTITALNRAYDVKETRPYWQTKPLSLGMTIAAAAMIVVCNIALIVGPDLAGDILGLVGLSRAFNRIWALVRWPLIAAIMMFMLACVYYFLPNVRQKFRLISPGAITAVLIWIAASLGFDAYVSHFNTYAKTYGTLGTAVILMMWLYISCVVVVLGGEINAILDRLLKGIRHVEKRPGPVTKPDPGCQERAA